MAAHKHAEWIKAKADGQAIQYTLARGAGWHDMDDGDWGFHASLMFRIKPAAPVVEYPVTRMSTDELYEIWRSPAVPIGALTNVANAALRHAIDSQQVIRMAEVQEIASQLGKEKRAARDLAVAKEVVTSLQWVFSDHPAGVWQRYGEGHLKELIARVK